MSVDIPPRSEPSPRFNRIGSSQVDPFSVAGIRAVFDTVRWGIHFSDKVRIAAYYALRAVTGTLHRDRDLVGRMYPKYWIGDVSVRSPIGDFVCRARTVDFDIINPRYEAIELERFRDRLVHTDDADLVCLDVGAHIGKFSIYAGRLLQQHGRVLAFEPEPMSFAMLERNLRLNQLANVEAFQVACGSFDGPGYLSRSTTNIGAHTLRQVEGAERTPVMVRTLDMLLSERGLDKVDVMKVDVESKEADVFRGAQRMLERNRGIVVFFEEKRNAEIAESITFLRRLGFRVLRLAGDLWMAERNPDEWLRREPLAHDPSRAVHPRDA